MHLYVLIQHLTLYRVKCSTGDDVPSLSQIPRTCSCFAWLQLSHISEGSVRWVWSNGGVMSSRGNPKKRIEKPSPVSLLSLRVSNETTWDWTQASISGGSERYVGRNCGVMSSRGNPKKCGEKPSPMSFLSFSVSNEVTQDWTRASTLRHWHLPAWG
jgi:hypothetical protein